MTDRQLQKLIDNKLSARRRAKQELAAMRCKAKGLASEVERVAVALREGQRVAITPESGLCIDEKGHEIREFSQCMFPSAEQVVELLGETAAIEQKIASLTSCLKEMGCDE
ncbi:MAG: hypothetical protein OXD46_14955 [Chloroflexi bacterium]|nr:hypothetical protein [Chloroflexota bacterium]